MLLLLIFTYVNTGFLYILLNSCGVSSSKATGAKVIIALYIVNHFAMSIFCHMSASCLNFILNRGTNSVLWGAGKVKLS